MDRSPRQLLAGLRRRAGSVVARAGLAESAEQPHGPQLACRAPFTSLHIDQFGDARPCCQSSRVLGNVSENTLTEIWEGESLDELRTAISDNDLSLGCEHCEWAGRGGRETTYAVRFDRDRIPAPDAGPTRLELAPSNSCNLQCTMCNGDWSSSIRLHREGRPALPRRFGDQQLAEVEALADQLDEIQLFGGEPFLMPEALRLLDLAATHDVRCVITTNGSVLTPRVAALLERPGIDLVVSVDGTSPEVYESIRRGATWADLTAHLDQFQAAAARHGNRVDLAHCLMTSNWHEFPDHLTWAAGRGLGVYVNDVLSPESLSLHHLTPPELAAVVRALRARQPEIDRLPASWRTTWDHALEHLDQTLADGAGGGRHAHLGQLSASNERAGEVDELSPLARAITDRYRGPQASVALDLGPDLVVRRASVTGDLDRFDLGEVGRMVGRRSADVQTLLERVDEPESRAVLQWDRDAAIVERRYDGDGDGGSLAERRTIRTDPDHLDVRFDYWLPPTEADERTAIESVSVDGRYVELVIDGSGTLVAIGPTDLAQDLGLRTELGIACLLPTDVVTAERADPAPVFAAHEIEPGLVAVDLRWDDGQHLVALAHSSPDKTVVRLGRLDSGVVPVPLLDLGP